MYPALCVMSGGSFNLIHATGAVLEGGVHAPLTRGSLKPSCLGAHLVQTRFETPPHTAEAGSIRTMAAATQAYRLLLLATPHPTGWRLAPGAMRRPQPIDGRLSPLSGCLTSP